MKNEKKQNRWRALLPSKRRLIQLYAALLFNANLKGFANGYIYMGPLKNICTPGLNCYSCPGASGACPLGALQNALASSNKTVPYYMFGIILLYGILFGRWICGFLCPFGLIQDLVYKIKTPKLKKSGFTRALSYLKYVILAVFVFIIPLAYAFRDFPLPAFCKYICPAGTLEGAIGLLSNQLNSELLVMLGPLFTWKFVLLICFLVGAVFAYRFFCRFFCPLGALYGLFNKIALVGVKLDRPKCIDCGLCQSKCKMDIRHVGDRECINCGECMSVCPTKAISWKGSKFFLPPDEIAVTADDQKRIDERNAKIKKRNRWIKIGATVTALVVLLGALVYYNFIDKPPVPLPDVGYQVGNLCYSEDIRIVGGEGGTFNVDSTNGKVRVINFWFTTCGPCLEELPHFDALAKEYADDVLMIAICANSDESVVDSFVAKNFGGYTVQFGLDNVGESYYTNLGGVGTYPMTLVLDEDGVIVARYPKPVSYDELKGAIELAMQ